MNITEAEYMEWMKLRDKNPYTAMMMRPAGIAALLWVMHWGIPKLAWEWSHLTGKPLLLVNPPDWWTCWAIVCVAWALRRLIYGPRL